MRSLVVTDSHGEPESLVLIMDDVTEWASAEQRFEKTFAANPAPAVICRLSDLRYIKVNPGFLEMTGYARDQVIGSSTYELDILDQARKQGPGQAAFARRRDHSANAGRTARCPTAEASR